MANISKKANNDVVRFYNNIARKYRNIYSLENIQKLKDRVFDAMNTITAQELINEKQMNIYKVLYDHLPKGWTDHYIHKDKNIDWLFCCDILEDNNILVLRACKSQNLSKKNRINVLETIKNKQYNTMNNTKKIIRLTEWQLHNLIKESIKKVLQEGKNKDPMSQWFADFNKASKFRETMDYINKGGRNPLKKPTDNGTEKGRVLNEYEDYVGSIYDTEPQLGYVADDTVRDFAEKILRQINNKIASLQRKFCDDNELCDDLQSLGEFCMMAKSRL